MIILSLKNIFNIFFDYAIPVVPFPPLHSTPSCSPPPSHIPPTIVHVHGSYISVLWLLHFLYYSYPPPVYFLPTIYATYSLYLSPPLPASPLDNPPCDLHFCGSVPVLVACLVCFCVCFRCDCNNCEFAVLFTVHTFYLLFLR